MSDDTTMLLEHAKQAIRELDIIATNAAKEIDILKAKITDLERVLKMVHWVEGYKGMEGKTGYCPWCNRDASEGDRSDCPRQAVLNE